MAKPTLRFDPLRVSLADIEKGLSLDCLRLAFESQSDLLKYGAYGFAAEKPVPPYIKIILRKTDEILLYEHRSMTAPCDTDEGKQVEEDNKRYEYLTVGPGRRRRTVDGKTQTAITLYKTREANTEHIRSHPIGSYVSNFEMFDTYKDLETSTKRIDIDKQQRIDVTTYKVHGVDAFIDINEQPNFKLALMLTMRMLAGNVFEQQQRRFRNMYLPDPLAEQVVYRYRLQLLWRFQPEQLSGRHTRRAVTDFSWCPCNGDILAVAYGVYTFSDANGATDGYVCVWNIKNPINPERYYQYKVPVMAVEFSPFSPSLLAVGLFDGTIEVLNISNVEARPVAVTDHKSLRNCEPVIAIKWLAHDADYVEKRNLEPFLALARDSAVTHYRIVNSPQLLAQHIMLLDRVEVEAEGVPVARKQDLLQSNRHPQALNLCLQPTEGNVYYVLTDEGCRQKCSTNYPMQHLEVLQIHEAGANDMDYSPWSPKLFLTCGNDWCINIWLEGILEPILTLKHGMGPVHCARWSKTHSTIIVSLNRSAVHVWDIRRSTLRPMSSTNIGNEFYTQFEFSKCGRSIAVGNEGGDVLMLAFEDMPFPPYYQFEQLKKAIFKIISTNSDLTEKVKSIGYFGYPEQKKIKVKKLNISRKGRD